jgi:hypothetical protein
LTLFIYFSLSLLLSLPFFFYLDQLGCIAYDHSELINPEGGREEGRKKMKWNSAIRTGMHIFFAP